MVLAFLIYHLCFVLLPALWLLPWIWKQTADFSYTAILSLATGPLLGASTLFLLMVLFPASGSAFFLSAWLALNVLLVAAFFVRKNAVVNTYSKFFTAFSAQIAWVWAMVALVILFSFPALYASLRGVSEHDTYEYMILGRHLYETGQINFSGFRFLPGGFFYVALHGFIYPLLYTSQLFFSPDSDLIFKSMSLYYALLLVFLFVLKLRKLPLSWLLPSLLLLLSSYGFIFSILQFHLESIRIFLLFVSLLLAWDYMKRHRPCIHLLGLVLGLQAGLHFIGLVASLIIIAGVFFFNPVSLQEKTWVSVRLFFFVLLLGAVHYLLEWITDPFWWKQVLHL